MSIDARGAKVENFRLTKDQLVFQKKMKAANMIKAALQIRFKAIQQETKNTKLMWDALEQGIQGIEPPPEGVTDLSGMNFAQNEEKSPEEVLGVAGQRSVNEKVMMNY